MGPSSSDISDCEVMVLTGLPASGKTTWADEYPEKLSVLLGRNLILDEMRVPILVFTFCPSCRKDFPHTALIFFSIVNDTNLFFYRFLGYCLRLLAFFYQSNQCFQNACTHKLRPFSNFCKIAVVDFPKPEDLEFRVDKRFKEMGMELIMLSPKARTCLFQMNFLIRIYISRFALWNSLLSISGSISKVPVLIFLLACSSILGDITLLLRETANFRVVSPSIPRDFGDITSKLKTGKSRRRSSGSC
ncbi:HETEROGENEOUS NUCLEAR RIBONUCLEOPROTEIN U [Salix purpurea]|uniref:HETEROGENEOUS NUCLEAR RIBONUCLEOPROTEIN U n=1 Tax=Salix purpurea TaxID=77065 RepID=A0A9Q0WK97_SALPP|nr:HETEROGENEOUS NUCLEAR RIBONUCLEOPROTEIN U [Salix purpurea]